MAYLRSENSTLSAESSENLSISAHIITDVLYPAVANIMVDGSTALSAVTTGPNNSTIGSSKYGTVQSDGRMYYYTDIKGSKPIKDPRIGSHFGSQRHRMSSFQLLEQETGKHGINVYSVDGREWMRLCGPWTLSNDQYGDALALGTDATPFVEIVGYFNDFNVKLHTRDGIGFRFTLNGGTENNTDRGATTVANPLGLRYVSSCSVLNVPIGASLGINTVKLRRSVTTEGLLFDNVELIAQDTTDTASKSEIQIHSQNVVSHGKKFAVPATAHHYDPFNGFTNSTTLHSAVVDTATSLGLSTPIALHGAPWAISGSNHIRPYNGGRVVKWVDSNGVIKTSVNVMPPNAQNLDGVAAAEITTPSATNTYLPAFSDDDVDHSLAEVAKLFYFREFGNGAANGGTGATYADCTMLASDVADNTGYTMDDGLTSCSGPTRFYGEGVFATVNGSNIFWTFIGTGLSVYIEPSNETGSLFHKNIVQNLPYGTHTFQMTRTADNNETETRVDGILLNSDGLGQTGVQSIKDLYIHQPKRPPIPDDCIVLADYMLMADFVANGASTTGHIGKGMRMISCSRDVYYDGGTVFALAVDAVNSAHLGGFNTDSGTNSATKFHLPFFGDAFTYHWFNHGTYAMVAPTLTVGGAAISTNVTNGTAYNTANGLVTPTTGARVGDNISVSGFEVGQTTGKVEFAGDITGNNRIRIDAFMVHTPIHTSSHYQTFETPMFHELVGGDRNMEQTNLVVTPDGKTWDEVTRDVSYIGNQVFSAAEITDHITAAAIITKINDYRGVFAADGKVHGVQKDVAIAYDRYYILKAGSYQVKVIYRSQTTNAAFRLIVNSPTNVMAKNLYFNIIENTKGESKVYPVLYLQRGDYLYMLREGGTFYGVNAEAGIKFQITRV
jgi:hypothetical protein